MPKISYVITSRNDSYGGDSVGRLQKTLNHTGYILAKNDCLTQSELILVDWATPQGNKPLREVLDLNEEIKSILKIVEVPENIAFYYQKDSPFSEVHAMNAGFRRSNGDFFARIDQDTLIGERFVNWFYNQYMETNFGFEWPRVVFSGRRDLNPEQSKTPEDFIFSKEKYKEVKICHSNNFYSRVHPDKQSMLLFYGGAIGILIIDREIYNSNKGYNEDYIYMNNMDTEFLTRLKYRNDFYNLGLKCDGDFYHLYHSRLDGAKDDKETRPEKCGIRKTNPGLMRHEEPYNSNEEDWGLNKEDLQVSSYHETVLCK